MDKKWKYDAYGYLRGDVYDKIQIIGKYEAKNNVPAKDCITSYFGDMTLYEMRDNVTKEIFTKVYKKVMEDLTKITFVETLKELVFNSINQKILPNCNRKGGYYRLGMKTNTKEMLEAYLLFCEKENYDIEEYGENPALELEVEFDSKNDSKINEIKLVYYFEEYETIYSFTEEEIAEMTPTIMEFINRYDERIPNNYIYELGDAEFYEAIPRLVREKWLFIEA